MAKSGKKKEKPIVRQAKGSLILNKSEVDELRASGAFSSRLLISPRTERPFFYFQYHGDALEGFLGIQHTNTNIRRSASRLIETPDGVQEFFVNQKLAQLFRKYDCEGKYLRITYIGQEFTGFGHARKCYQVELLPVTSREKSTYRTEQPAVQGPRPDAEDSQ